MSEPRSVPVEWCHDCKAIHVEHVETRLRRAELVAEHWRKAMLDGGDQPMPMRLAAHALCMVLAAVDGETDPDQLGVGPGEERDILAALQRVTRPTPHHEPHPS